MDGPWIHELSVIAIVYDQLKSIIGGIPLRASPLGRRASPRVRPLHFIPTIQYEYAHIRLCGRIQLYYGSLKDTPYKWLDLGSLFRSILKPNCNILKIRYFTARVSARLTDPSQPERQNVYIRAIKLHCPEIEVHYGHFMSNQVNMPLANPTQGNRFAQVIKTEEKGSDVNLSVHLLNDCWKNDYDCAVVVSNDSDIAESMRLVRGHVDKKIQIGLITPGNCRPSKQLKMYSDFHQNLRSHMLKNNQLPSPIPNSKLTKPKLW